MELKIVSKEIAIELENLGFNWELDKTGVKCFLYSDENVRSSISVAVDIASCKLPFDVKTIQAPTQSLVIKWFEQIHNILIYTTPVFMGWECCISLPDKNGYHVTKYPDVYIINANNDYNSPDYSKFKNRELAEEIGILKAIEIIKSKRKQILK